MDMNNELIDERAASPVGQPFRVCASKTEAEALELTKTNPNILYFSSDTNTIIFNGVMRTNPTPDLSSVLKKTDIIDNTSTNDNTKVLSAKQGKLLNDTKLNKTDVIGNLTNTDDTKALAASQGKILNDKKIDKTAIENTVNSSDVNKVLSAAMGKFLNDNKVAKSEIVDDTSTDDATKPLSARQGKSLQYEITVLENNIQDLQTSIPTKTSQLTNDSNYLTSARVLTKDNTDTYSPTANYHPSTKQYVDNSVKSVQDNVILKNNNTPYNPANDYNPATKKYVDNIAYGKVIVVSDISKFLYNVEFNGADAEQRIVDLFGSIDNFKNVVADILANHTRYYFHINNNLNNNCIELSCVNAWRANDSTSYELHFVITYFGNNPIKMFTNRISIVSNDDNRESKVIIASLVNSDNINTLTKKTSDEYNNIASKDNETMYAITDA